MSYCRFSCDDYDCDVYVYESVHGGWQTCVAAFRYDLDRSGLPAPVEVVADDEGSFVAWYQRHQQVSRMVANAGLVPIGLPHDGQSFVDDTPGTCADRLAELATLGYHVPDYAITALRAEQAERDVQGAVDGLLDGLLRRAAEGE